ncbi:hypothetical protein [Diaminobutyricibacter sp. McL0608]|uniref:hypothetical protein n=1 Tax=Leifsonia sp. McL0608 TaxID=3143537 RepID=UPI0031F32160
MSDLTASDIVDPYGHSSGSAPTAPVQDARAREKLGRRAMIMAIAVFGVSLVVSILIAFFGTTMYTYGTATSAGFRVAPNQVAFGFQALFGTVFGTWAVVQGIVAAAKNRGRSFGVVAIVVGASAPIVSVIVWLVLGAAFGHHVSL